MTGRKERKRVRLQSLKDRKWFLFHLVSHYLKTVHTFKQNRNNSFHVIKLRWSRRSISAYQLLKVVLHSGFDYLDMSTFAFDFYSILASSQKNKKKQLLLLKDDVATLSCQATSENGLHDVWNVFSLFRFSAKYRQFDTILKKCDKDKSRSFSNKEKWWQIMFYHFDWTCKHSYFF